MHTGCAAVKYLKEGYTAFEKSYPFLCTASVKANSIKLYPSQVDNVTSESSCTLMGTYSLHTFLVSAIFYLTLLCVRSLKSVDPMMYAM